MKRGNAELALPAQLDKNPIPLVSESTHDHAENFLLTARESIGYPIEGLSFKDNTLVFAQDPIFEAVFIDYTKLPYIDYLSNIYRFRLNKQHRREAQEIYNAYQELVQNKHAYVFLRMFAAGDVNALISLFDYLDELARKNQAVRSTRQLKLTNTFTKLGENITESHILISTFIFS